MPVIFAFTRRHLSRCLKRSAKTSCVAVLSYDGAGDLFNDLIKQANVARAEFQRLTANFPADRERSRHLVTVHPKGGKSHAVDELFLHAQVGLDIEE